MSGEQDTGGGAHVQIGSITGGSQAFGSHGTAESTNHTVVVADPKQQHLLTQVRALRGELARAEGRTADDDALDAELGELEGEISRAGAATPDCSPGSAPAWSSTAPPPRQPPP
ncbi:MAG: hypothetical protein WCD21_19145 [Streptomyces sp.]